jgi:hypothetical protein
VTLTWYFSLEDASGDGELDLSGIDDLEIDRVSDCFQCLSRRWLASVEVRVGLASQTWGLSLVFGLSGLCGLPWASPDAP